MRIAAASQRLSCALAYAVGADDGDDFALAAALLSEQLDMLSRSERAALGAASIFDGEVASGAIGAVLEDMPDLTGALASLCDRKLLVRCSSSHWAAPPTFAFAHELVRAAALRTLSEDERAIARQRATRWFAALGTAEWSPRDRPF